VRPVRSDSSSAYPATPFPAWWHFTAAFSAVGVRVYWRTPIYWEPPDQTLYRDLAAAFLAGFVVMIAWSFGESLFA
jgi:hypothetical protein